MTAKEYNQAVELYADGVYRFILKNMKDDERSRDVVQDSFEKLWIKRDEVDGSKVRSYLFSTAYHTMIDVIRREKRVKSFDEVHLKEPVHESHYTGLNEVLHQALERLPETQRSVVMLRDYEGYSYDEIAEITGLSESQVKVYIYRARLFLKNYIGSPENVI
jgi:RNA polymerase sigma-70 factor (ECF subfamily)